MTENISQMIRWNANFVRGLAQTVLERAKTIRSTLKPGSAADATPVFTEVKAGAKTTTKRMTVKKAVKKTTAKKAPARKTKRTHA
jgi:hypothetical protein